MGTRVYVNLLPQHMPADRTGCPAVVIDVLRASTTIVQALAAGAELIVPCLEIAEARHQARLSGATALLAGERGGRAIPGFDLGNSPSEYQPAVVAGRRVVFTTTNGTRALRACDLRPWSLLAAFTNLSAVVRVLQPLPEVDLVCAGTDGDVTREDVLLAGCLADIVAAGRGAELGNDSAALARDAWRSASGGRCDPQQLESLLVRCQGGRNLQHLGLALDLRQAAAVDQWDIVPIYHPAEGQIVRL